MTGVAGSGTVAGRRGPLRRPRRLARRPSLPQIAAATGLKQFSLGFIINGSTACTASWFNAYDPATGWDKADFDAIRAAGGDVRPVLRRRERHRAGPVLHHRAEPDRAVPEGRRRLRLDRIDFDIEGAAVADHASIDRRSAAIARSRPRSAPRAAT